MAEGGANKYSVQEDKNVNVKWTAKAIGQISSLKDVFLVIFGSMASISITVWLNGEIYDYKINTAALIFSAATALVLLALAFLDGLSRLYWKKKRERNVKHGKYLIGIIRTGKKFETDGDKWNGPINNPPKWSGITCNGWKDKLTEGFKKSKVEYVSPKDDFTRFNCIVNPYGGAYYEESFSEQKSMHKILKYTSEGGVYVNVADIPFFYAYNIETDMWLYNSSAFNVIPHLKSKGQKKYSSTTGADVVVAAQPGKPSHAGNVGQPEAPVGNGGIYIDYNFYILKELGITFLMPYLGGDFENVPQAFHIYCNGDEPQATINLVDTRPFFISEICPEGKIKVCGEGGKDLTALNWLNQEYKISPIAAVPNGRGRLIISTVSLHEYPSMMDVIIKMIGAVLGGKQPKQSVG